MQNLFDKASLVMVPSGYDNGKLYNIKPEDKSSAFEFERATAATRVDSSGIVETFHPEVTNLLLQSNQFDTTWGTNFAANTPTAGQNGYDGSSNAWLFSKGPYDFAYMYQDVNTSGLQTYSIYAKANTLGIATLYVNGNASNKYAKFNLSDGSVLTTANIITSNTVNVGNGWYRLSITFNDTISRARVYPDFSETNTGSILIQNSQLETGSFATPYIETTTQTVTRQNKANQPRIDYASGEGTLLLEPQRTNLFAYSDDLSRTTNTNQGPGSYNTVTLNYAVSPDGTYTADRLEAYAPTGASYWALRGMIYNTSQVEDYTHSVWLKSNTGTTQNVIFYGRSFQGSQALCEVTTEWKRFDFTGASSVDNYFSYVGTRPEYGSDNNIDVLVWGLQLEQGSYATSYIPTNGQTETRLAESWITKTLNDVTDTSNGFTFFIETSATELTEVGFSDFFAFRISDADDDSIRMEMRSSGSIGVFSEIVGWSTLNDTNPSQFTLGQVNKIAIVVTNNIQKLFVNGVLTSSFTNTITVPTYEHLRIERGFNQAAQMKYGINQMVLFPEALIDEELQGLTSLSADATTFTELANNNGYTIL